MLAGDGARLVRMLEGLKDFRGGAPADVVDPLFERARELARGPVDERDLDRRLRERAEAADGQRWVTGRGPGAGDDRVVEPLPRHDPFQDVRVEVKTLVVPEGGELPPEEELAALEAAEAEAAYAKARAQTKTSRENRSSGVPDSC